MKKIRPLRSVTRGQCNVKLTVTLQATEPHHSPFIGWYQIILPDKRGTRMLTTCSETLSSCAPTRSVAHDLFIANTISNPLYYDKKYIEC